MTSTVKRFIMAVVVLAALIVFFVWSYVFKKADTSVSSQNATVELTANDLVKAFESNESTANAKYNGKVILVSGTIADVKVTTDEISVYLKEATDASGVMCSFNKVAASKNTFKSGRKIKIKGLCTGYLMDVVLTKCAVQE
ncbi:MAG: hypothetical protein Q8928_04235 [Bacteroidota bacterium]|nr:hypothetical protein [Bacteroidota bacterium]